MLSWYWGHGQMTIAPQYILGFRLSILSNLVLMSHQMADISRFMWKWVWPQFQGNCFDMSMFFYIDWKALPYHSRKYKSRLNYLRNDWVITLLKELNFTHWTRFFEVTWWPWGMNSTFLCFNILARTALGPKMTFLTSQAQIVTHTHTHTHIGEYKSLHQFYLTLSH